MSSARLTSAVLEVRGLCAGYGDVTVLWDVHLQVREGEVVALLGPNGAGKTTLIRAIFGLQEEMLSVLRGEVWLDGQRVVGLTASDMVYRGVALVPEGRRLFPALSVEENLLLGGLRLSRSMRRSRLEWVYALLPLLREKRRALAGTLSGGQQQLLALGRALIAQPRLLLLDEPSLGLAPRMVRQVYELVDALRGNQTSVLVAEQNVGAALSVADRGYVLGGGRVVLEGDTADLRARPALRRLYLGV